MKKQGNVLSIDIESWVHKYFLEEESSTKKIKDDGYINKVTLDILRILESNNIKTTFFVTAEIFDWYPDLIYKMKEKGHEIGFHTYTHRRLIHQQHLLDELKLGKRFIDEFNVKGFRAPEAIIKKEYFTILRDWGFTYDSSIYSASNLFEPIEGISEVPISTLPFYRTKRPVEFPRKLTMSLMIREIPFGSGYFIGLFGSNIQWFIQHSNKKNIPAVLILHPWQIQKPPRDSKNLEGNIFNRIKMIPYNINRNDTFNYLCEHNEFVPMTTLINTYQH